MGQILCGFHSEVFLSFGKGSYLNIARADEVVNMAIHIERWVQVAFDVDGNISASSTLTVQPV